MRTVRASARDSRSWLLLPVYRLLFEYLEISTLSASWRVCCAEPLELGARLDRVAFA